jgi:FixJ family two-component response regulator
MSAETFMASSTLRFDGAIAVIDTPATGGHTFVRRLQQRRTMTPVILVTVRPEPDLDEGAIPAGAQRLPRIPFEIRILFNCVDRSLSDDRAQR